MSDSFKFKDSQGRTIEGTFDRDGDTFSFTRTSADGQTVDLTYSGSFQELVDKGSIAVCVSDVAWTFARLQ